jgi:hypothetical protein
MGRSVRLSLGDILDMLKRSIEMEKKGKVKSPVDRPRCS